MTASHRRLSSSSLPTRNSSTPSTPTPTPTPTPAPASGAAGAAVLSPRRAPRLGHRAPHRRHRHRRHRHCRRPCRLAFDGGGGVHPVPRKNRPDLPSGSVLCPASRGRGHSPQRGVVFGWVRSVWDPVGSPEPTNRAQSLVLAAPGATLKQRVGRLFVLSVGFSTMRQTDEGTQSPMKDRYHIHTHISIYVWMPLM